MSSKYLRNYREKAKPMNDLMRKKKAQAAERNLRNEQQPELTDEQKQTQKQKLERAKRREAIKGRDKLGQLELYWKNNSLFLASHKPIYLGRENRKFTDRTYRLGDSSSFHTNILKLRETREFSCIWKELLFKAYYKRELQRKYDELSSGIDWTQLQRKRDINRLERKLIKTSKSFADDLMAGYDSESFATYIEHIGMLDSLEHNMNLTETPF